MQSSIAVLDQSSATPCGIGVRAASDNASSIILDVRQRRRRESSRMASTICMSAGAARFFAELPAGYPGFHYRERHGVRASSWIAFPCLQIVWSDRERAFPGKRSACACQGAAAAVEEDGVLKQRVSLRSFVIASECKRIHLGALAERWIASSLSLSQRRQHLIHMSNSDEVRVRILAARNARALHDFRPLMGRGRRESRVPIAPVGPVQQKARG